jgi:ParB family chromosome partitioning protein
VPEKKKLGRGLEALLGANSATADSFESLPEAEPVGTAVLDLPLEQIEVNPFQPRKDFDPDELDSLKKSLSVHGLLQPVVVRPTQSGSYQLVAGERRLRAAREVGWTQIPVRILDFNDQATFEAALVENMQRTDLNAIEKAQGFFDYLNRYQVTHEELARKIGMDRTTVTNLVRLLELPPQVQDMVRTGQISNGHARALLSLEEADRQVAMCREIIAKGLSVRAVEQLVKELKNEPTATGGATTPRERPEKTAHVQSIEEDLRQRYATKVEIKLKAKEKGQIVLGFETNEEFERLLEVLRR